MRLSSIHQCRLQSKLYTLSTSYVTTSNLSSVVFCCFSEPGVCTEHPVYLSPDGDLTFDLLGLPYTQIQLRDGISVLAIPCSVTYSDCFSTSCHRLGNAKSSTVRLPSYFAKKAYDSLYVVIVQAAFTPQVHASFTVLRKRASSREVGMLTSSKSVYHPTILLRRY